MVGGSGGHWTKAYLEALRVHLNPFNALIQFISQIPHDAYHVEKRTTHNM